jgi:hypothetical protein
VQTTALFLLGEVETIERAREQRRADHRAIILPRMDFLDVFPEYGDVEQVAAETDEDIEEAVTGGDPTIYQSGEEEMTDERFEKLMQEATSGSFDAAEAGEWT